MRHVQPLGHPESVYFPESQTDNVVSVKEGNHGGKIQNFRISNVGRSFTSSVLQPGRAIAQITLVTPPPFGRRGIVVACVRPSVRLSVYS